MTRWKGIMKCYPFEESRLNKWQPPYIVQPKYDGIRCRAVYTGKSYILLSSEENIIFSVPHINKELGDLNPNVELDGELYCHGMSFEEITSITSRTVNLHPDYEQIKFYVFDVVNDSVQAERLYTISTILGIKNLNYIELSPFWICYNLDDIMKVYDNLLSMNYEGIIVRNFLTHYERKRSTYVMKFKPKKTDIYVISGIREEISKDGVPKNRLGSIICRDDYDSEFSVGSGLTDELREKLWNEQDNLIGKRILVSYQHVTSHNKVPRFPVFINIID